MKAEFWHERWQNNDIAFHLERVNPQLERHFGALNLTQGSRIFLPLCGKTNDIPWLLSKGYQIVGAELSEMAIQQLFEELGAKPTVSETNAMKLYQAQEISVFVGDIFDLSSETLGEVDAIFDRGALVALPVGMRNGYTDHLIEITNKAPQLLITYEYNQQLMAGPPFSISKEELNRHYADSYQLKILEEEEVPGDLKGQCPAQELAWLLK